MTDRTKSFILPGILLLGFLFISSRISAQKDSIPTHFIGKMAPDIDYVIFQNKNYSVLVHKAVVMNIAANNSELSKPFKEALDKSKRNIFELIMKKYPDLEINLIQLISQYFTDHTCMVYNRNSKQYEPYVYLEPHSDVGTSGTLYSGKAGELFYNREIIH